jgi:hypothetical protein
MPCLMLTVSNVDGNALTGTIPAEIGLNNLLDYL